MSERGFQSRGLPGELIRNIPLPGELIQGTRTPIPKIEAKKFAFQWCSRLNYEKFPSFPIQLLKPDCLTDYSLAFESVRHLENQHFKGGFESKTFFYLNILFQHFIFKVSRSNPCFLLREIHHPCKSPS